MRWLAPALAVLAGLTLARCAEEPDHSSAWTVSRFLASSEPEVETWKLKWHFAHADAGIFWTEPPLLASGDSLVVQPAFEDGQVAAYVLTELWYNWPAPWEQPAYHFARADGGLDTESDGVFGVGEASTFYSPFWRVWLAQEPEGAAANSYRDAKAVLDAELPLAPVRRVLCPLVPQGVGLAKPAGSPPIHPLTGAALADRPVVEAWFERAHVWYLDVGAGNTYAVDEYGRVQEGKLYRFVKPADPDASTADPVALKLPAVLQHASAQSNLFREYRVELPPDAVAFVPAGGATHGLEETRTPAGHSPPVSVDPNVPPALAAQYLGRVALHDGACFADAGSFPGGCTWLDSAEAIEASLGGVIQRSDVQVTAPTLLVGDVQP